MVTKLLGGLIKEGLKMSAALRDRPSGLYNRWHDELTLEEVCKHLAALLKDA